MFRPFINEPAVRQCCGVGMSPAMPCSSPATVCLDPPSVDAGDESIDRIFGNGERSGGAADISGDCFRRLIIIQAPDNFFPKGIMSDNLHSLILGVFSPDVRFVGGLLRVILSAYPIAEDFCTYRVGTSFQQRGDLSYAISFFLIPSDLVAVALREVPPRCVFFSYFHFRRLTVLIQKRI